MYYDHVLLEKRLFITLIKPSQNEPKSHDLLLLAGDTGWNDMRVKDVFQ